MIEGAQTHTALFDNKEKISAKRTKEALSVNPPNRIKDKKEVKQFRITKKDFTKRNLELIKKMEERKLQKEKELEEENLKKEKNKEVLKYVTLYKVKKIKLQGAVEPSSVEKKTIYNIDKRQINKFFKSRYASLIKNLPNKGNKNEEDTKEFKSKSQDKKWSFSREREKENLSSCKIKGKSESKASKPLVEKRILPFSSELEEKNKQYIQKIIQEKEEIKRKEEQKQKQKEQNIQIDRIKMLKRIEEEKKNEIDEEDDNEEKGECEKVDKNKEEKNKRQILSQDFIQRNLNVIKKNPNIITITDLQTWKKKNKVDEKTKVFIITGGYGDIRRALLKRGWIENKEKDSPCFDLKWALKIKEIDYNLLQEHQIINHFDKNTLITTKVGLCHSLRNLIWFNNVDIDTFYPICFDLNDETDIQDFKEEFKSILAESIIKKYIQFYGKDSYKISREKLVTALSICLRKLIDIDEMLDIPDATNFLVSDEEWNIIAENELTPEMLARKRHDLWMTKANMKIDKTLNKNSMLTAKNITNINESFILSDEDLRNKCVKVLDQLKKKFSQFDMNGYRNIWIIKPAGMSRGRGIKVSNNLSEILDIIKNKEQQWVVQKYIENPLTILNRKFDLRQWVLVTSFNPLVIWFYNICYARFSAIEYTQDCLSNKFIHLTNNSVAKHYTGPEPSNEIEGNMWEDHDIEKYLTQTTHDDIWNNKIKKEMKKIIIWSLECVQDNIPTRKKTCELFGYDFMIDENYNPYLIEVNSSPSLDYSTKITEKLVKMLSEDIIKVIVDYSLCPKKKRSTVDTGLFSLIYKSKKPVDKPFKSFGLNLVCEGKKIKIRHELSRSIIE